MITNTTPSLPSRLRRLVEALEKAEELLSPFQDSGFLGHLALDKVRAALASAPAILAEVEEMEADNAKLRSRPCPYIWSSDEGTHHCELNEPHEEWKRMKAQLAALEKRGKDGQ